VCFWVEVRGDAVIKAGEKGTCFVKNSKAYRPWGWSVQKLGG
jgi:hypothetical protein